MARVNCIRSAPLLLLCLTVLGCLPVLAAPEWQGTEARRVQIALEMAVSGDWWVPTLGWEPTLTKPPLLYWVHGLMIQAGGVELVQHPWVFRIPSMLALWLVAWCAFGVVRRMHDLRAAWLAAAGVICSPVLLHEGPRAEIDPPFAAATAAAMLLLAEGVVRNRRPILMAAGVVAGLAWMLKAVPFLLFGTGPLLIWLWARRGRGLLWFLLPMLLLPGAYYALLLTGPVDPAEFRAIVERESVGRISTWEWQHVRKTPGALLRAVGVLMPLGLWWMLAPRGERRAGLTADQRLFQRMLLAASLLGLAVLMVFPGRPTRYMLPAIPTFLAVVAPTLARIWTQEGFRSPWPQRVVRVLQWLGVLLLVAGPFLPGVLGWGLLGPGLAIALGGFAVRTPRDLILYALVVPLMVAATGYSARYQHQHTSSRSEMRAALLLREELERRDLLPDLGAGGIAALRPPAAELATLGHIQSDVLLWSRCLPTADEFEQQEPTARWLLFEDHPHRWARRTGVDAPRRVPGYVARVRIQTRPGKVSYVLAERIKR